MARPKSTSGSKTKFTDAKTTKEQLNPGSPANIPDVKPVESQTPAEIAAQARVTPEARKLEVVKSEPRKNVIPINRAPMNLEDEIRRRAYELYLQREPGSGSEAEDWLTAEREVRQRYQQQQSA